MLYSFSLLYCLFFQFKMSQKQMNFELFRLETFNNWPSSSPVSKETLARAGFFYINEDLQVKCFSCHILISDWDYGDQAVTKHRNSNENCRFIINPDSSGNIPLTEVNKATLMKEEVRLKTFQDWPFEDRVSPRELAKAGFYWLHINDKTKCAFCKGIAENWLIDDDPVQEHHKLFPNCDFGKTLPLNRTENRNFDYGLEENRLESFLNWPKRDIICPERLARAGFFYIGKGKNTIIIEL